MQATDEKTGQPVANAVLRKEGLFHGKHYDLAPDLIVHWRENQILSGIVTKVDGQTRVARSELRDDTIGSHHPDATLLLWGRGVQPGSIERGQAHIMDLAPSVLALLGCQVPPDLDGTVLPMLDVTVSTLSETGASTAGSQTVYSAEEEAEVEDRLRNLGYL
jgi:predicted AlkP superfamily phosphohydrolase/phosphomutase